MTTCPKCNSCSAAENGSIFGGKKKFMCKECNRQFVENPSKKTAEDGEWAVVDKLLLERLSLPALSRAVNISRRWIHEHAETKREYVSNSSFQMSRKEKTDLEADELWSFVGSKKNGAWVWLAIERKTRPVGGCFVGKRAAESALGLWNSLSQDCKKNGIFSADGLGACRNAFPSDRHEIAGKKSGRTSLVGRLSLTFRQRLPPLAGKTISFSRKIENIKFIVSNFVQHCNECIMFH